MTEAESSLLAASRKPEPLFQNDKEILGMWRDGFDTFEIAKRLNVHQSKVANRLARLRDAGAA